MLLKKQLRAVHDLGKDQAGKVIVKFYWWPLIISLALSVILTVILNIAL